MSSYLFTYSAKSLQTYIMKGGKLRDMVGATSLIDRLSDSGQLSTWLKESFGLQEDDFAILQAAAGGGRIRFRDEATAKQVSALWPLWCHAWAPDLEVVQHLMSYEEGTYSSSSAAVAHALERARNFPAPRLPEAGPFVKKAPRTGEAAVRVDPEAEKELIDLSTTRKRQERKSLNDSKQLPPVATAFGFTSPSEVPNEFTEVSGGEGRYLAIIHADGNRLGQMFLDVGQALAEHNAAIEDEMAIQLFQTLSQEVVSDGTRAAAKAATQAIEDSLPRSEDPTSSTPWPLAPIVLAGDDLTVVTRDDLAIPFTRAFLLAFREEMRTRLSDLRHYDWWSRVPEAVQKVLPGELSAGAGIVFCTDHYPFSLAYELCENLASQAKSEAKKRASEGETPPSALSFVRISGGSAPTDFRGLENTILHGADGSRLTGVPYYIDDEATPTLDTLLSLCDATLPNSGEDDATPSGLPSSTLRDLLTRQRTEPESLGEAVERMLEVAGERARAFEDAWIRLCGTTPDHNWKSLKFAHPDRKDCSPLLDLLTLLAVQRGPGANATNSTTSPTISPLQT